MQFTVKHVCGEYVEVHVDEASTGTLDKEQARSVANSALNLLDEMLVFIGEDQDWAEVLFNLEERLNARLN